MDNLYVCFVKFLAAPILTTFITCPRWIGSLEHNAVAVGTISRDDNITAELIVLVSGSNVEHRFGW